MRNWNVSSVEFTLLMNWLEHRSLPEPTLRYRVQHQPSHGPGEHWVALWLEYNVTAEYFYPFAQTPDHEMEHFLKRHAPGGRERNHRSLQNVFTTVWGVYVMVYLYGRNVKRHCSMRTLIKERFPLETDGKKMSECKSWCGKCSNSQLIYLTFIPWSAHCKL